jgi:hypothetical protein
MLTSPLFECRLKVFNWVQIRTIGWPIKHYYTLIYEPILNLFSFMDLGIILHKSHPWLIGSRDLVAENSEIRVSSISRILRIRISIYNNNIRATISINSPLDHDTDVFTFLKRLYYIFIPLLVGRSKDSKPLRSRSSFQATFITKDYL